MNNLFAVYNDDKLSVDVKTKLMNEIVKFIHNESSGYNDLGAIRDILVKEMSGEESSSSS